MMNVLFLRPTVTPSLAGDGLAIRRQLVARHLLAVAAVHLPNRSAGRSEARFSDRPAGGVEAGQVGVADQPSSSTALPPGPRRGLRSVGMNLQCWQIKRIHQTIGPALGYLFRLRRRMEQTFDRRDPLFLLVCQAYDALHSLSVDLHYRSCEGVGPPPELRAR